MPRTPRSPPPPPAANTRARPGRTPTPSPREGLRVPRPPTPRSRRRAQQGVGPGAARGWLSSRHPVTTDHPSRWRRRPPPAGPTIVSQGGSRRLVDELEAAWDAWIEAGALGLHEHGMTVTADDEQFVWAGDPDSGT